MPKPAQQPTQAPALPPGCKILNDGPGREVLVREVWDECLVFATVAEATAWAWEYANDQD